MKTVFSLAIGESEDGFSLFYGNGRQKTVYLLSTRCAWYPPFKTVGSYGMR